MFDLKRLEEPERNREILRYVLAHQSATRNELVEKTGLTLLTVSKAVTSLLEKSLLVVDGAVAGGMGRRKSLLKVNPEYRYVIGVDIGYANIKVGVVLFNGRILEKLVLPGYDDPIVQGIPYGEMLKAISSLIDKFGRERFLGVGASISGMVDFEAGRVLFCPNIGGFDDRMLADEIARATSLPVLLDTSARCMALGESYFGAGSGKKNQIFLSLGVGSIAAGLIVGGKPYRGADGFAGEIGHTRCDFPDAEQQRCSCGSCGCLELYATQSMACKRLDEALRAYAGYSPARQLLRGAGLTGETLRDAYRAGEPIVAEYVEAVARAVALALSASINLLDPELVTLGGGFMWTLPELALLIDREIKKTCLVPVRSRVSVRRSTVGEDAPIQGSALQVIHHYLGGAL